MCWLILKVKFNKMKKIILSTLVLVIAIVVVTTMTVKANRSYGVPPVQTATATTSVDYMRATNSVLVLDAYAYSPTLLNSATLFVQSIASTSNAVQTITIDYSNEGANGVNCKTTPSACDWFADALSTTTSASVISLNNSQPTYTITGNDTASTTRKAIGVKTPTRYIRATVATSTALSSVWLQWIPVREMTQ